MKLGLILGFIALLLFNGLISVVNAEKTSTSITVKETIKAKPGATGVNAIVNDDGSVTLVYSITDKK